MKNKVVTFIKKEKVLVLLVGVAILLISSGIYIGYIQNNRVIISKAINNITTKIEDKYLMKYEDIGTMDNYTLTSKVNFSIESDYLKQLSISSPEYLVYLNLINNLSKTDNQLIFKQDKDNEKLFIDYKSTYNSNELISYKYLIENNTEYYYLKGFLDNYINNGTSNYFETLKNNETNRENIKYVYEVFINSFKDNLKKEYFTKTGEKVEIAGKEKTLQKVTLELDNNRLIDIFTHILEDLKKDEKANKILTGIDNDFKDKKVSKKTTYLDKDQKLIFSAYVDNLTYKIKKYQLDIVAKDDCNTITYEVDKQDILNIYENKTLVSSSLITYKENQIIMDIKDKYKNSIGQILIKNENNSYQISVNIQKDDVNFNFSINQNLDNIKKNKSYNSKLNIIGLISSQNSVLASIKIDADNKVSTGAEINENTDKATFAKDLDSNKQQQLQQVFTNIFTQLMS